MGEFKSWNSYRDFANRLRRKNRFIRTQEDDDFFLEVLRTSETRIKDMVAGISLWRAQLGHAWRSLCEDGECVAEIPTAYPRQRMKPIPDRAKEGRVNPKGIPVLYLSTRPETAMSEVRPWIGSLVSCAQFKTTRALQIVDLSDYHEKSLVIYFDEQDVSKRKESVWAQIVEAFYRPTTDSDDTADYIPTQVIVEFFKTKGYDGIAYKSAFGDDGCNIALFNPDDAELTSYALHKVQSAEFTFKQAENPYRIEDDGRIKTMSIDVIGPARSSDSAKSGGPERQ